MPGTTLVLRGLRRLLKLKGYEILHQDGVYEWQRMSEGGDVHHPSPLPQDAAEILDRSNPQLKSLEQRYSRFEKVTTPLIWHDGYIRDDQIRYFRGDNGYVWQLRGRNMNPLGYALTTYYVLALDKLRLLDRLKEDDAFGNFTFQIANTTVSRDLLDSIIELYFLNKHLDIAARQNFRVLDIGAGYGRLAHRTVTALPNLQYLCTDAVPVSTLISDFYLRFRGVQDRATVVPLDQIEQTLETQPVDLAINIHSFSECQIEAIDWWLRLVSRNGVRYFMIVPNTDTPTLLTNDGNDFQPLIEQHGYRSLRQEPKYNDPLVQQYGLNPSHHFLFELR
jgi:hypothetical protein